MSEESKFGVAEGTVNISTPTTTYKKNKVKWDFITEAETVRNAEGNLEFK